MKIFVGLICSFTGLALFYAGHELSPTVLVGLIESQLGLSIVLWVSSK